MFCLEVFIYNVVYLLKASLRSKWQRVQGPGEAPRLCLRRGLPVAARGLPGATGEPQPSNEAEDLDEMLFSLLFIYSEL